MGFSLTLSRGNDSFRSVKLSRLPGGSVRRRLYSMD